MPVDKPLILVIYCSFGWGYCGDRERLKAEIPNLVPVICCGSIEAERILEAFRSGFEGVLLLACPRGECHFQEGEWQCLKRVELLKELLVAHGIDRERLSIHFGNDPEGESMAVIAGEFDERLRRL